MFKTLNRWIRANSQILNNSGALVGTMLVTSVSGFIYWWLAARNFTTDTVGLASASISAMSLLGTFGILGLGTLLIGELQRQYGQRVAMITNALAIVAISGGVLGLLFALIIPFFLDDFQILSQNIASVALFAIGVGLTSMTIVLDQALVGLLRGNQQFLRNTIFAVAKLSALFLAGFLIAQPDGLTIYATWALGNILSVAWFGWLFLKKGYRFNDFRLDWTVMRKLGKPAIQHHILNMSLQAPGMLLPMIVTAVLSSRTNAYFYTAWMIASVAFYVPVALTTVLYAVGAANQALLSDKMKLTLRLSLVLGILGNIVLFAGADFVLALFKPEYADAASWCLRLLGLGFFPLVIKNHFVAYCRIQKMLARALYITGLGALVELALSALGAKLAGLNGLCVGWLVGLSVEAVLMFPTVYRVIKPPQKKDEETSILSATVDATRVSVVE